MPRFFFDVAGPDHLTIDPVGHDCENLDEARQDALETLREIIPQLRTGGPYRFEVIVSDEQRRPVLRPSVVVDLDIA
jgi:hypothetical protein